ncbi:MAG: PadR family transcriptional regulator [Chthoniobacterales bacterium]
MARSKDKLLPGTLEMLVLKALCHGRMHGYGIARRIRQLSYDALTVEAGSLYPALFRLNQQGYIKSEWDVSDNKQSARFYTLTTTGRKQLERETENWDRLSAGIVRVLQSV